MSLVHLAVTPHKTGETTTDVASYLWWPRPVPSLERWGEPTPGCRAGSKILTRGTRPRLAICLWSTTGLFSANIIFFFRKKKYLDFKSVLGICDILVQIQIRIQGSVHLTKGSGSGQTPDPNFSSVAKKYSHRHIIFSLKNLILC
jgi:hypothetical protein